MTQAAAGGEDRSIAGMAVEVPTKPWFSLDEEGTDVPVRVCPATPTG